MEKFRMTGLAITDFEKKLGKYFEYTIEKDISKFIKFNCIGNRENLLNAKEHVFWLIAGRVRDIRHFYAFYIVKKSKTKKYKILKFEKEYFHYFSPHYFWNHFWEYSFILVESVDQQTISKVFIGGTIQGINSVDD